MKITFEGTLRDILDDMTQMMEALDMLADMNGLKALPVAPAPTPAPVLAAVEEELRAPWPIQKVKPPIADKPVEKKPRTEKQLANDERMRVAALARIAAKRAAKAASVEKPVEKLVEKMVEELVEDLQPPPEPFADPAEIVQLRTRTMEELQEAYANGHHKEVLELLSRFGDGAKSFRELPPESFVPIRQAIDKGALT